MHDNMFNKFDDSRTIKNTKCILVKKITVKIYVYHLLRPYKYWSCQDVCKYVGYSIGNAVAEFCGQ